MDTLTDDQRYAAIAARDARFDGVFFVCVRSTGIFCRPTCPSRTPGRRGVEFVDSAAAAVARGYRACKRCGPLAPPGSGSADPAADLTDRALRLIHQGALDAGPDGASHVADLARRLHVSERTLHRALLARTGAGAVGHARMTRARRAHELLRTTSLPMGRVAVAAGFGSERQMHETLSRIFGHSPSQIRERAAGPDGQGRRAATDRAGSAESALVTAELAVRRPFDAAGLVSWFSARAIRGVEQIEGMRWRRAVRLPHGPAVLEVDLGVREGPLPLTAHLAELRDYPAAIALARRLLDLDADPLGIDAGLRAAMPALAPLLGRRPGVRIPGTPSLAEALLWAVVGQQITTVQAREQITRATDLLGAPLPGTLRTGDIHRLPVVPEQAAQAAADWFRGPAARRRALAAALSTPIDAEAGAVLVREQLLALPGIGPWTADYALLRGLRAIDVAPPRDAALLAAARDLGIADDHPALTEALGSATPWRSYASMQLWHHSSSLSAPRTSRSRKDPS